MSDPREPWPARPPQPYLPAETASAETIRALAMALYEETKLCLTAQVRDQWLSWLLTQHELPRDEALARYEAESKRSLAAAEEAALDAAQRAIDLSWLDLRELIWKRDGGRCRVCGVALEYDSYACTHIVDRDFGGSDRPANLVGLCPVCRQAKPPTASRESYAAWARSGGPVWAEVAELVDDADGRAFLFARLYRRYWDQLEPRHH